MLEPLVGICLEARLAVTENCAFVNVHFRPDHIGEKIAVVKGSVHAPAGWGDWLRLARLSLGRLSLGFILSGLQCMSRSNMAEMIPESGGFRAANGGSEYCCLAPTCPAHGARRSHLPALRPRHRKRSEDKTVPHTAFRSRFGIVTAMKPKPTVTTTNGRTRPASTRKECEVGHSDRQGSFMASPVQSSV